VDAPAALQWGLVQLRLPPDAAPRLLRYLDELQHWNEAYNLTAVRAPVDMVFRHVLDSLVVLPHMRGRIVDVGSGAGLPGVPLAIANPTLPITLLDSSLKKARFLRHVKRELALDNVEVLQQRVEKYHAKEPFDTVVSRAFAALGEFLQAALHLCAPGGRLLAMVGRIDETQTDKIPKGARIVEIRGLHVPGLHEARHLVTVERSDK
jgi:16S rRNA (guanine527-N7)-methyltransferase